MQSNENKGTNKSWNMVGYLYGTLFISMATHELAHAATATYLGYKVSRIRIYPWIVGSHIFIPVSMPLHAHAKICLAGPVVGSATAILCSTIYKRINNESFDDNDKIIFNLFSGMALASQLINFIPKEKYDGNSCLWDLKTRIYKKVSPELLQPRCGVVKSIGLQLMILSSCLSFYHPLLITKFKESLENVKEKAVKAYSKI